MEIKYKYKDRKYTLEELMELPECRLTSHKHVLKSKLNIYDGDVAKALACTSRKCYKWKGELYTLAGLERLPECLTNRCTLQTRLRRGISLKVAMTTPPGNYVRTVDNRNARWFYDPNFAIVSDKWV